MGGQGGQALQTGVNIKYGAKPTDDPAVLQQKIDDLKTQFNLTDTDPSKILGVYKPTLDSLQSTLDKQSSPTLNPTAPTTPTASNPTFTIPDGLLPSAPNTVTSPSGGITGGNSAAGKDEASLLAEAELQKQLASQTNSGLVDTRSKNLTDLADLITQRQQRLISQDMPGLYEDLNTRGLLRSSELGNAVSREQAKAAANLQDTIGQQAIADSDTNLNNLKGIEDNYLTSRSSAIQRAMSLADWQRQVQASKDLGFALQPQAPSGNGKSATGLNAAIGGATVGSKFGPQGALLGAGAGLIAGQGK